MRSGEADGRRVTRRRVVLASLVGTTIEWYDFFAYSTAAALVFSDLFFPKLDETAGTLASLATIMVGFVARPLGAVMFGHIGDRVGRKATLVATILLMGAATFAIGLLPTFGTIGIAAPALLVTLRLLQGIGVAGEWGGAVLMAVEHAPRERRGLFGSFAQVGAPAGLLLSTGVFSLVSMLPDDQFEAWGWRIPFLTAGLLVAVALYIRLRVVESPAFEELKEKGQQAKRPVVEVIKSNPRNVLLAMGARVADNGSYYIFSAFALAYATGELDLSKSTILNATLIASAVWMFTIPAYAALSDRVGRRPVYLFGTAAVGLFAFPFFWLLDTKSTGLIILAMTLALAAFHAAMYGPQAAMFAELFATRTRYSGASLGYNAATVVAGGPAPFVATAFLSWAGGEPWPVALYLILFAVVTFTAVLAFPETRGVPIEDERSPVAPDTAATGV
jgi:MHS family shikimate/dehydroshikimate transporter-like MFS transporter